MALMIHPCIRTLRLKVKREGYGWLNRAAIEVNQVWNYANAVSYKAARPFAGKSRWPALIWTNFQFDGSSTSRRLKAAAVSA